jgi:hypothetical protein
VLHTKDWMTHYRPLSKPFSMGLESRYGTENSRLIDRVQGGTIYRQGSSRVYRIHPINGDPA